MISDAKTAFVGIDVDGFFFHIVDADISAALDALDGICNLALGTLDLHRHRAVILVPHPSGRTTQVGGAFGIIAETNRLNAAVKADIFSDYVSFCKHTAPPILPNEDFYGIII